MSIEERSRERRRRMVGHRATSFEDAESWDLELWQSVTPEERLSALVAIRMMGTPRPAPGTDIGGGDGG